MIERFRRVGRYYYLRFRRLKGDPKAIALGTAVGVFVGIVPTVPLNTLMIIVAAMVLPMNIIASLIAATVVCNPLTIVFQYYLCYLVGNVILPGALNWGRIEEILMMHKEGMGFAAEFKAIQALGFDALAVMLVGGVVIAVPFTLLSYWLSLRFFYGLREKRRRKHILD